MKILWALSPKILTETNTMICFHVIRQGDKTYPIYTYKDVLQRFPSAKRNVFDVRQYRTATVEKLFNVKFGKGDIHYVNQLDNYISSPYLKNAPQFTRYNCITESEDYILLGGNDHSIRPDLGNIDAAALILFSKKNPEEYYVFNQPFREINNIFKTIDKDIFLVEDGSGIYKIRVYCSLIFSPIPWFLLNSWHRYRYFFGIGKAGHESFGKLRYSAILHFFCLQVPPIGGMHLYRSSRVLPSHPR